MTLDLSAVTDSLIGLVRTSWDSAPIWSEIGNGTPPGPTFTPTFTGLAPDAVRQASGPQLSMYLYHVESDSARESLFWQPQMLDQAGAVPTRFMPLALNLYYLLFAYSESSYAHEHEAMSVALRIYHDNPIVRSGTAPGPPWELTLTMEHRSYDELSHLWQATTAPLRMSLVYRASVVLLDPDEAPAAPAKTTSLAILGPSAAARLPPAADAPSVFGTSRDITYTGPAGAPVTTTTAPATVAAGQTFALLGAGLGAAGASDRVYLLAPGGGPEVDVTAWAVAGASSPAKFVLTVPSGSGGPPAGPPAPGIYQLRVGSGDAGTTGAVRSGSTPLSVAAHVNPAGGPVLSGAGPFTVAGTGFIAGFTEVFVGSTPLAATPGTAGPGQVDVAAAGTSFSFAPPPAPAGTVLPVRVRVHGIDSDPALWVRS